MYNAEIPEKDQLPSSIQLLRATFVALLVSIALLFTTILPANYGVDPTGLGRVLGLTEMGEIKVALELEAAAEEEALAEALATQEQIVEVAIEEEVVLETEAESEVTLEEPEATGFIPLSRDSWTLTLAPAETAEIKVRMNQGDLVLYSWQTESGTINFDNHGDNESISYHNYTKGTFVEGDQGVIEAAFDGSHGWFWRNRGDESITLTLSIQGAYTDPRRLL
ncbi:MAG: transmembrane anchor protein [Porticoccaceae bacterium]|jgi:hypothetical protein|nr:transmembrane anchor protein [Porticoccaceae bacterium]